MKSFLVLGLGRFGYHLTRELVALGNEVMVLDRDEDRVSQLSGIATATCIGDCQDEQVLRSLGVDNFNACFVCVSDDFQCSLETTAILQELGAKYVVSRADREKQIRFLLKIGADYVVNAEMDTAKRIATSFSSTKVFDYFELSPQYAVFEITTPVPWVGHAVKELDIRSKYNINILGIKFHGEIVPLLDPNYVFQDDTHLIIAGDKATSLALAKDD
ncbi:TrkA family potassium uptake protein [Bengtsoniella intestinalis]|uniref:potassium channel family protein n=1 Tax=Bengtsoniella intestinalis TaxID=3073143 RepID=UPI00391FA530